MKLYHYSKDKYKSLTTKEKRGEPSEYDRPLHSYVPGKYNQSISFLFDPIPVDLMSSIYGNEHRVWFSGNRLYEYIVDSSRIGEFKYHIVESPENSKLVDDDSVTLDDYLKIYPPLARKLHYLGAGNEELQKGASKFVGKTEEYIRKAQDFKDWPDVRDKYAAYVPHVMIYPQTGEIDYQSIRQVILK